MKFTGFSIGGMATKVKQPDGRFHFVDADVEELSAVDMPAQEGALAAIAKRHVVASIDKAEPPPVSKTPRKTRKGLGAVIDPASTKDSTMDKTPEELAARIAELEAENAALKAAAGESEKMDELPAEEEEHAKSLAGPARTAFLAKSAADRKVEVESTIIHKGADGEIYRKGQEQLVAVVKKLEASEANVAIEKSKVEEGELMKRAELLKHLPQPVAVKAAVLKAIAGIEGAEEMLRAADAAVSPAFKSLGAGGDKPTDFSGDPYAQITALAKSHQAKHGGTIEAAKVAVHGTDEGKSLLKAYAENKKTAR